MLEDEKVSRLMSAFDLQSVPLWDGGRIILF